MNPPVELTRPTILNLIAIICYCLAIVFHIIAYATNGWSSLVLDGVRWDMGLWQGCADLNGTRHCTSDIFSHKVFQSGSDWHLGGRVLMTLSLILLFILEFVLLGYACIQRLQVHKTKLVGSIMCISIGSGILTLATIILVGTATNSQEKGRLEWSYGMLLLTLVFQILCSGLVAFTVYKDRLFGKSMKKSKEATETIVRTNSYDENRFSYVNATFTVVDLNLDDSAF